MDRRDFFRHAGAAAALAGAGEALIPGSETARAASRSAGEQPRVTVAFDPSFPDSEGLGWTRALLDEELRDLPVRYLGAAELRSGLQRSNTDVLIITFGSAFPAEAFPAILEYLRKGGHLVMPGGVPFACPVHREGSDWRLGQSTTAYHKELGITQVFAVSVQPGDVVTAAPLSGMHAWAGGMSAAFAYELYLRLATEKLHPGEDGSEGIREGTVTPLLQLRTPSGEARATVLLRVDWLRGRFAGGRWLLAPFHGTMHPTLLRTMVDMAALGAMVMTARPERAVFRQGERPTIVVRVDGWKQRGGEEDWSGELSDATGALLSTFTLRPVADATGAEARLVLPPSIASASGLYIFRAAAVWLAHETGFWLRSEDASPAAAPLLQPAADGFGLTANGEPFPVTGTTYMCGEAHRRFLLDPNPAAWECDMARMKAAGVNLLRTGIWTAWSEHAAADGTPREDVLRALEAFLLTAQRYELPVIFTFFAFLPPVWGGTNAYLDPEALRAQTTFVTSIVRRCRAFPGVVWDLINEPSFCSPRHLWTCRPNGDEHERKAWRAWLDKRLPGADENAREAAARELFRDATGDIWRLPDPSEFADANIFYSAAPVRPMEYRLFAQEAFAGWARTLGEAIRAASHPRALVTVGQDEGGAYERPSPQLHADAVDLTSVHTWWCNDDLLWDTVMTKAPGVPLLVEETGAMFYETLEGTPWRTEYDVAALVARKFALAMADSAGFVQWLWNTNPYLPSDNEAAIGFLRADGSVKPELEAFRRVARFIAANRGRMRAREEGRVWMVIPHSNMFSVRNEATDATRRCVRAMAHDCGMPLRAVSEFRFAQLVAAQRSANHAALAESLVVVPSPRTLTGECWKAIIECAGSGATVLITGPVDRNEYLRSRSRMDVFEMPANRWPVAQEETLDVDGRSLRLSYRGERMQRCEKAMPMTFGPDGALMAWGQAALALQNIAVGSGRLLWSPLPVELSEGGDATAALYAHALKVTGLDPLFAADRSPSVLVHTAVYADAVLYTLISEGAQDSTVTLTQRGSGIAHRIPLPAQGTDMVFLRRDDGAMIARMNEAGGD